MKLHVQQGSGIMSASFANKINLAPECPLPEVPQQSACRDCFPIALASQQDHACTEFPDNKTCLYRRQPTMHSSRADVQSPHAASPTSTSPTHFAEDRAGQTSTRPSLDNGAEQPARSAASESGSTPRSLMNGASNPTTFGQAGKAANAQRQQQPQVSLHLHLCLYLLS